MRLLSLFGLLRCSHGDIAFQSTDVRVEGEGIGESPSFYRTICIQYHDFQTMSLIFMPVDYLWWSILFAFMSYKHTDGFW